MIHDLAVLAIDACMVFAYNKKYSQTSNKEQVKEIPINPPK